MKERTDLNSAGKSRTRTVFLLLGAAVLAAASGAAVLMIRSKPRAGRREAVRVIPVVEVADVAPDNLQVTIECA